MRPEEEYRAASKLIEAGVNDCEIGRTLGIPRGTIRGLIHSDGNRHINPVTRRLRSGIKRYRYTRYMFTNVSDTFVASSPTT
ncbi:MAG TPA: hypothetical protein VF115_04860 [Acidimicrobiia bacterium]